MAKEYLTSDISLKLKETLDELNPDKVLVVTDINVEQKVFPHFEDSGYITSFPRVIIPVGEEGKNLSTVVGIWEKLEEIGATRRSVVVNIGGGVVTDLGGFAAAAFKRGIRTINIPTTLLGAVDAATGGKTGINFLSLKNEIGAFHLPSQVIISPAPFATLPEEEILSGYAEMVKTAIISDRTFYIELLDLDKISADEILLGNAVEKCVGIKEDIVAQDPHEKGLRKVLNFGHTAGHAFESLRIEKKQPVTHGKAVAHGMLVALILSNIKYGFDSKEIGFYADFLRSFYGMALISCKDITDVIEKMKSDKKNNTHGQPLFTLLTSVGNPEINCMVSQEEISEALEIYVDMMG